MLLKEKLTVKIDETNIMTLEHNIHRVVCKGDLNFESHAKRGQKRQPRLNNFKWVTMVTLSQTCNNAANTKPRSAMSVTLPGSAFPKLSLHLVQHITKRNMLLRLHSLLTMPLLLFSYLS